MVGSAGAQLIAREDARRALAHRLDFFGVIVQCFLKVDRQPQNESAPQTARFPLGVGGRRKLFRWKTEERETRIARPQVMSRRTFTLGSPSSARSRPIKRSGSTLWTKSPIISGIFEGFRVTVFKDTFFSSCRSDRTVSSHSDGDAQHNDFVLQKARFAVTFSEESRIRKLREPSLEKCSLKRFRPIIELNGFVPRRIRRFRAGSLAPPQRPPFGRSFGRAPRRIRRFRAGSLAPPQRPPFGRSFGRAPRRIRRLRRFPGTSSTSALRPEFRSSCRLAEWTHRF